MTKLNIELLNRLFFAIQKVTGVNEYLIKNSYTGQSNNTKDARRMFLGLCGNIVGIDDTETSIIVNKNDRMYTIYGRKIHNDLMDVDRKYKTMVEKVLIEMKIPEPIKGIEVSQETFFKSRLFNKSTLIFSDVY